LVVYAFTINDLSPLLDHLELRSVDLRHAKVSTDQVEKLGLASVRLVIRS
jgi:hypothetical protein